MTPGGGMTAVVRGAGAPPRERRGARILARAGQVALTVAFTVVSTAVGLGWLYALRTVGLLGHGPRVGGALPLQRLAVQDSQPLLRFVAAWLPTGVAGAVLAQVTGLARGARATIAGLTTFAALFAAGAGSDAVTANERVALHLGAQFRHGAIWLAAAIVAACVFAVAGRARRPVR